MEEVINTLHELPQASVYGEAFDRLFDQLKEPKTVAKLMEVDIADYAIQIRSLRDLIDAISRFRTSHVIEGIRAVPAIVKWEAFI